jgi:hypothetical protein
MQSSNLQLSMNNACIYHSPQYTEVSLSLFSFYLLLQTSEMSVLWKPYSLPICSSITVTKFHSVYCMSFDLLLVSSRLPQVVSQVLA